MARDGSGNYSLPEAPFVFDTVISETEVNSNFSDIGTALTQSLSKDGQTDPTANLPMANFKFTGLAAGSAATDSLNLSQAQAGAFRRSGTAGGTKNALTISPSPAITAYATGQRFTAIIGGTSSDDATTIAVSGLPSKAVEIDNAALSATVFLETAKTYDFEYDGTAFQATRLSADLQNVAPDASQTVKGLIEIATQAEADVGSSALLAITPDTLSNYSGFPTSLPVSYLGGLGLSNGTDTDHDIDIALGACRDAANAADISLSAIVKQIDAIWVSGTNQGGLSSSLSPVVLDTWYHVFAIIVGGSADVGFDTSINAANLITDHSATSYRRIGSVLTDGSANIISFSQDGEQFLWSSPVLDVNASNPGTTEQLVTLSTPLGVKVLSEIIYRFDEVNGSGVCYVSSPDADNETPSSTVAPLGQGQERTDASSISAGQFSVRTDILSQIRYRFSSSGGGSSMRVSTIGWRDRRGQN